MKIISEIIANILAIYYNGYIRYNHINSKGSWEFTIENEDGILYKTKGLK
jgi:hypothetical protein